MHAFDALISWLVFCALILAGIAGLVLHLERVRRCRDKLLYFVAHHDCRTGLLSVMSWYDEQPSLEEMARTFWRSPYSMIRGHYAASFRAWAKRASDINLN